MNFLRNKQFKIDAPQVGVLLAIIFIPSMIFLRVNRTKEDKFESETGLNITDSIFSVAGKHAIVLKTTKKQIEKWIDGEPPFDDTVWHYGQVLFEIGDKASFTYDEFPPHGGIAVVTDSTGKKSYSGNEDLERILNDSTNYFAYKEYCCADKPDFRFWSGELVILQPETGIAYYRSWHY